MDVFQSLGEDKLEEILKPVVSHVLRMSLTLEAKEKRMYHEVVLDECKRTMDVCEQNMQRFQHGYVPHYLDQVVYASLEIFREMKRYLDMRLEIARLEEKAEALGAGILESFVIIKGSALQQAAIKRRRSCIEKNLQKGIISNLAVMEEYFEVLRPYRPELPEDDGN
ncbi:MAG: hypothetical protein Q9220_007564 [cf. Caloplaca sp. 1 TL-2023]